MDNCLLTALKGNIQNDSFPYLNELRLFCRQNNNVWDINSNVIKIELTKKTRIRSLNGANCIQAISGSSETIPGTGYVSEIQLAVGVHYVAVANMDCEFYIEDKFAISELVRRSDTGVLNIGLSNISQLNFSPGLLLLKLYNSQSIGELDFVKNNVATYINLTLNDNCGINVENVPETLQYALFAYSLSYGNIENLVQRCPNLVSFECTNTRVYGTIENICSILRNQSKYDLNFVGSKGITVYGTPTNGAYFNLHSADNGVNFVLTNLASSQVVGTYNTQTQTWTFN